MKPLRPAISLPSASMRENCVIHNLAVESCENVNSLEDLAVLVSPGPEHIQFEPADSWFRFSPVKSANVGRASFLVEVEYKGDLINPAIYCAKSGVGFVEEFPYKVPLAEIWPGFYFAELDIESGDIHIRFDPSEFTCFIGELRAVLIVATPTTRQNISLDLEVGRIGIKAALNQLIHSIKFRVSRFIQKPEVFNSSGSNYLQWQMDFERQGLSECPIYDNFISIICPVFDPKPEHLCAMFESVLAQTYQNWQLCVTDDASTSPNIIDILRRYEKQDSRIQVKYLERNGGISVASNAALSLATGELCAMLDHDDVLAPIALASIAEAVSYFPNAKIIYSDEDKLNERGERCEPFFKPAYSPELLRSQNYFNHLTAIRTDLIQKVGGWRSEFDGSQDYDLVLRVTEHIASDEIIHIPKILYHWRMTEVSTSKSGTAKSYAYEAGMQAIREHLSRIWETARVEQSPQAPYYRVLPGVPLVPPLATLIIPTRDKVGILRTCVDSILEKTTFSPFEILIVDNGSEEQETREYLDLLRRSDRIQVIRDDGAFNFSRINNAAARHASGEILVFLNNDVEVIDGGWLEELVSWAIVPGVGCVGSKLIYPDGTLQHGGIITGIGGVAGHDHKYAKKNSPGYFCRLKIVHNVAAVTAACLAIKKEKFAEVGGFDEENLQVAFNDVDLCLRLFEAGYRNVWSPYVELIHHESLTRGQDDTPSKRNRFASEVKYMRRRWGPLLDADPFYSPCLSRIKEDYSFANRRDLNIIGQTSGCVVAPPIFSPRTASPFQNA